MKKIILSVAAATMALTTAASAIENVKADGQAKLIYQMTDNNLRAGGDSLTSSASNAGQASIMLGVGADLSTNLKGHVEVTGVSTLGLENSLVNNVMATSANLTNQNAAVQAASTQSPTDDQFWISQAYLSYTAGKTTATVGIQELNTPLAFTEKWNVTKNTFQAITLVNNDIDGVTLVGAYVGKSNSSDDNGSVTGGGGQNVNYDGKFNSFYDGAYAVGAITKISDVNLQAWFYNIQLASAAPVAGQASDITAYWLEADTKVAGIFLGAQYAGTDVDGTAGQSLNAWAVKAGGDVAGVHLYAAYSSVNAEANTATSTTSAGFANTATGDKTKLYTGTGSIYADGANVAGEDTKAWKVGAKTKMAGIAMGASYTDISYGANNTSVGNGTTLGGEGTAWDVFAGTNVGPVALKAIYTQYETKQDAAAVNTFDRDTLRIIASAKF
jgi:hypothetical protein